MLTFLPPFQQCQSIVPIFPSKLLCIESLTVRTKKEKRKQEMKEQT